MLLLGYRFGKLAIGEEVVSVLLPRQRVIGIQLQTASEFLLSVFAIIEPIQGDRHSKMRRCKGIIECERLAGSSLALTQRFIRWKGVPTGCDKIRLRKSGVSGSEIRIGFYRSGEMFNRLLPIVGG